MFKMSEIPLRVSEHWLISRTEDERKDREIVKLRGEEADQSSFHKHLDRESGVVAETKALLKKDEF